MLDGNPDFSAKLGEKFRAELSSLASERDASLFYRELLVFGQRLEAGAHPELASRVYSHLAQKKDLAAAAESSRSAAEYLDALMGRGNGGLRGEILLKNLRDGATDYRTIVPMLAGSMVFEMTRTAALSRLAATPEATWLTRGFGARAGAAVIGTAAEIPTFSLLSRGLHSLSGEDVSWAADAVARDMLGAGVTLGTLKVAGWGMRSIPAVKSLKPWQQSATASAGTFTAMLAAHRIEQSLGLKPKGDGSSAALDTLVSMLAMEAGGSLGRRVLGPDFARFQEDIALRAESAKQYRSAGSWQLFPGMAAEAMAFGGGGALPISRSEAGEGPKRLQPLLSERQETGDSPGEATIRMPGMGEAAPVPAPPPAPQWVQRVVLDETTLARLESFPRDVQSSWKTEGANPVFFGLNHLKWWSGLIMRDAAEMKADAIVTGGKIMFARWQEKFASQLRVQENLREIARQAVVEIHWEGSPAEVWWRPLWQRALSQGAYPLELGMILQELRREHPAVAADWLDALANKDFDLSEAVRESSELETAFAEDDEYAEQLGQWLETLKPGDLEGLNREVADRYRALLEEPDLSVAIGRVVELKQGLENQVTVLVPMVHSEGARLAAHGMRLQEGFKRGADAIYTRLFQFEKQISEEPLASSAFAALSYLASVFSQASTAERFWNAAKQSLGGASFGKFALREDMSKLRQGLWPPSWWAPNTLELAAIKAEANIKNFNWEGALQEINKVRTVSIQAALLAYAVAMALRNGDFRDPQPEVHQPSPKLYLMPFPSSGVLKFGRDLSCDIRTNDPQMSRNHAEIVFAVNEDKLQFNVLDLGSSNGSFLERDSERDRLIPMSPKLFSRAASLKMGSVTVINKIPDGMTRQRARAQLASVSPDVWTLYFEEKQPLNDRQELLQTLVNMAGRTRTKLENAHHSLTPEVNAYLGMAMKTAAGLLANPGEVLAKGEQWLKEAEQEMLNWAAVPGRQHSVHQRVLDARHGVIELEGLFHDHWKLLFDYLVLREQWLAALWLSQGTHLLSERARILAYWIDRYREAANRGPDLASRVALDSEAHRAVDGRSQQSLIAHPAGRPRDEIPPIDYLYEYFSKLPKRDPASIPESYRHLIPRPKQIVLFPRFRHVLNEAAYLINAPERIAMRFFGPAGTGKTTFPEMIAAQMGVPLLRFPFSKRTDPSDLEGSWAREEIDGELVPVFQEGVPTIAMEHGFHLVLDEPDLARPGTLAFLNNVSAPGEYAWVRKRNGSLAKIKVHPGYRVYSTENGVSEVAREEHGKDFLRRYSPYYVAPWSVEEIAQVLRERYENGGGRRRWDPIATELIAYFHDKMDILARGLVDPDTQQAMPPLGSGVGQNIQFTPRSALRLAQRLAALGALTPASLSRAIRAEYILPLADSSDRELIWTQAKAIFRPLAQRLQWKHEIDPKLIPMPSLGSISRDYLGGRPIPQGKFIWTGQALRVVDEILWNRSLGIDVMLLGEAGEGKTEIPQLIAQLTGQDYHQKTMSSETDEEDLVGGVGRTNGKIEFIPDFLTIVTAHGGIGHLDEYLLADTGKLEGVMNPLMDAARALILKNPYQVIPRHPDSFFILTSNPPFGDYADRQEHSGAAMSRVAVLYLTDQFGMQKGDRLHILRGWLGMKSEATKDHDPSGVAPKDTGHRRLESPQARQSVWLASSGKSNGPVSLAVHSDLREKFKLPAELGFDQGLGSFVAKSATGEWRALDSGLKAALKKYADYLSRRTQVEMAPVTGKVLKILYMLGSGHRTSLTSKEVILDLADLLALPLKAALGVGKHEWAHGVIDRPSPVYDAHEFGRLYANVVGDPRMNEYVGSLRQDFAEQIDSLYQVLWPEDYDAEKLELARRQLPHEQFAHGIIYHWRYRKSPAWIDDPKVIDALQRALPLLEPAFTLFPESSEDSDVDSAAQRFYQILDEAYPIYRELIPESLQKLMDRLEAGEKPEDLVDLANAAPSASGKPDAKPLGDQEKQALQQLAQQILEARAEKMADAFEPHDPQAFEERKQQIAKRKVGGGDSKEGGKSGQAAPLEPLDRGDFQRIAAERQQIFQDQIEPDLFRSRIPARATQLAQRLKRFLPPDDPAYLEGHFSTGKRLDRKKAVEDTINPMSDGRVMLRRLRPGDRNANLIFISDVTGSVKYAGAVEPLMTASATAVYLSEQLKINYGEILMGSKPRILKPLGRPVNSYHKKNEFLNAKLQAFDDRDLNQSTNIREPLALAIQWVRERRARQNYIMLFTDGDENVLRFPKTLPELEAEAEAEGIHLMVLGLGNAALNLHYQFKPGNFQFTKDDGSDVPDRMMELFENAHRRRFSP